MGASGSNRKASVLSKVRECLPTRVDVLGFETRLVEKTLQRDRVVASRDQSEFFDLLRPSRGDRGTDVLKNKLPCDAIQLNVTASRQERKAFCNLVFEVLAASSEQCTESPVEPELLAIV